MRRSHTNTRRTLRSRFAAATVACLVAATVRGPLASVPVATAASTFRPTLLVNTEAFLAIDDDDTTANVVLSFGDTLSKTITFNRTTDRFEINDDVYVTGMVRATGAVSGAVIYGSQSLRSSGALVWEGAGSGSSLDLSGGNVTISRSGATVFNANGKKVDFGVFGATNSPLLYVDASGSGTTATASGGVGIGTRAPVTQLHVAGRVPTTKQGTWSVGTGPYDVEIQGKIAYIIDGSGNLKIADVSNASSISTLATLSGFGSPVDLVVQGAYAYVSTGLVVKIVDVSNPKSPTIVATTPSVPGAANYMAVSGPYLYLNDATNQLTTFDVSNPTAPVVTATATTGGRMAVDGAHLYAIDSGTLKIFSLKNPAAPAQLSSTTVTNGTSVAVQGRYAYIGRYSSSALSVVDVSDPATPVSVGSVTVGTNPNAVAVQGRYAYVTDLFSLVSVVDVSSPVAPVTLGTFSSGGSTAVGLAVAGRYAYVANRDSSTVTVFDLGGAYVQQLEAGGAEIGTLQLRNNLTASDGTFRGGISALRLFIAGNGAFSGALKLGHGLSTSSGNIVFSRTGSVVFNEQSRNVDLRMEGDGDANLFVLDASTDSIGIGTASPKAKLNVAGTLSGVTLYATRSFSGAGLTDCDTGATSKLLWDATTGRFSCGTDQTGGSSGGLSQADADARYVNTRGDTMTGKLLLQNTSIQASSGTFLGLDSNDDVVLTVKGGSMNMTDLQQWKDSSDTLLVNIGSDGSITAGNATFNGNLTANGSNIALGDANTDNVSVTADVNTDINPEYGGMQNLGNSSARWNGWFYNVDTSNDLNVGNNVSTSNLSASSYSNLTYLNVSNSIAFTNYTGGGSGCSALETDGMGSLVCGTDDAGGGWGTDYFNITDGMNTETIDETNSITFAAADSNISVNVGMTDTVTIGFTNAAGFLTSESDPTYYSNPYGYINSSSDNIGYDTYFNITDGSTTELINTWDNVTFSDGQNINVSVSATDTVTVATTDNVSFTNLNVSDGSSFGDNIADQMNISAGNWTFNNETIFTLNGGPLRVRGVMSGVTLYATRSFSGAGLTSCSNATTSKLLWDATTGRFSCGTDQTGGGTSGGTYTAGQGLSLNGSNAFRLNATITGSLVNFQTVSGAYVYGKAMSGRTLAVTGSGATPLLATTLGKPSVRIGGSGSLVIENRSTDPGSSPSNATSLFSQKVGGRGLLHQGSGSTFAASPLQNALFGNLIMSITTGAGTTVNGYGTTVLSDTTVSHPAADQTFGYMANFATDATNGDEAGTSSTNVAFFRGSAAGANGFFYYARVGVVDTTSITVFSGMADQTIATMVGADNPSGNFAGFQFSSGRGDANWQFTTKDNSTQNVVNSGLAFTANKVYDLIFTCTKQCASITWEIRNVTDGTSAQGTTSSNLPSSSAALRIVLGVEAETTAAKNIRMQQIYVEADR